MFGTVSAAPLLLLVIFVSFLVACSHPGCQTRILRINRTGLEGGRSFLLDVSQGIPAEKGALFGRESWRRRLRVVKRRRRKKRILDNATRGGGRPMQHEHWSSQRGGESVFL